MEGTGTKGTGVLKKTKTREWPARESFRTFLRSVAVVSVLFLTRPAHAAGETGGIGLTDEILIVLLLYPFIAMGFSYLLFRTIGKAWVFFLSPFFYMGLTMIASYDAADPSSPPAIFSLLGAWLYWTHMLSIAIIFWVFRKLNRAWMFFLAPILNLVVQYLILVLLQPVF